MFLYSHVLILTCFNTHMFLYSHVLVYELHPLISQLPQRLLCHQPRLRLIFASEPPSQFRYFQLHFYDIRENVDRHRAVKLSEIDARFHQEFERKTVKRITKQQCTHWVMQDVSKRNWSKILRCMLQTYLALNIPGLRHDILIFFHRMTEFFILHNRCV